MDWMLFWTAFGAIGGTIGAIATAAAVIVALWQTKYAHKKKLQVKFDDVGCVLGSNGKKLFEFISLTATNIGNREIVIDRWGFELNNNREIQIFSEMPIQGLPPHMQDSFRSKFPYTLPIEQRVTFYYEKDLFFKLIPEHCKNGELNPNKTIRFFVKDSTGQKHYCKTAKKACEFKLDVPAPNNEVK